MKILVVGHGTGTHIGGSFLRAAQKENLSASLLECAPAYAGHTLVQRLYWRLLRRRPRYLRKFSGTVTRRAFESGTTVAIATGIAPIDAAGLRALAHAGVCTVNFLTDDPWNPTHRANWFLDALPHYDFVFTPRRANDNDLRALGCRNVEYLPFGYDEELFYPEREAPESHASQNSDVFFAGGGDRDRIPYISALIDARLNLKLYGGYWERFAETRLHTLGHADPATVRRGLSSTKVALCLVRKSNRDGSCMRTFEIPATGACLLAEDTNEHREIFGPDGRAAVYFGSINEMVDKVRHLIAHDADRAGIAEAGHLLITRGQHTYRDRLRTMLAAVGRA